VTTSIDSIADLSFNNIDVIEGLDNLTKLQDLTLYNNRISTIEKMDTLTELHVLSLGNNDLSALDGVRPDYENAWLSVTLERVE